MKKFVINIIKPTDKELTVLPQISPASIASATGTPTPKSRNTLFVFQPGDYLEDAPTMGSPVSLKVGKLDSSSTKDSQQIPIESYPSVHKSRLKLPLDKTESLLLCQFCDKVPIPPKVCSNCQNIFCNECIAKFHGRCWSCKELGESFFLNVTQFLKNKYENLLVLCKYNNCGTYVSLFKLKAHELSHPPEVQLPNENDKQIGCEEFMEELRAQENIIYNIREVVSKNKKATRLQIKKQGRSPMSSSPSLSRHHSQAREEPLAEVISFEPYCFQFDPPSLFIYHPTDNLTKRFKMELSIPKYGACCTLYDKLYFTGGMRKKQTLNTFQIYSVFKKFLEEKTDTPNIRYARRYHAMCALNFRSTSSEINSPRRFHKPNSSNKLPCLKTNEFSLDLDDMLIVAGGFNQKDLSSCEGYKIEFANLQKNPWFQLPCLNSAKSGISLCFFGKNPISIYCFGGYFSESLEYSDSIEVMNFNTINIGWEDLIKKSVRSSIPIVDEKKFTSRMNCCTAIFQNQILIFGGINESEILKDCLAFDPLNYSFTSFPPLPKPAQFCNPNMAPVQVSSTIFATTFEGNLFVFSHKKQYGIFKTKELLINPIHTLEPNLPIETWEALTWKKIEDKLSCIFQNDF